MTIQNDTTHVSWHHSQISYCRYWQSQQHAHVYRVYVSKPKHRIHNEAIVYLADLIDVIDPVIKIVHPYMQLRVFTFASAMSLCVMCNHSHALSCPRLVDCISNAVVICCNPCNLCHVPSWETTAAALTRMVDTSVRAVAVVKQNEALLLHRGFIYADIQFMSPEYKPAASIYSFQGSLSD